MIFNKIKTFFEKIKGLETPKTVAKMVENPVKPINIPKIKQLKK